MNTCPHCGAKQGDVPLYSGLDGDVALAKVDASTIAERMGLTTR
jgi:RNA polymerase subunit RPABC4/transcription elongation factor Spt4